MRSPAPKMPVRRVADPLWDAVHKALHNRIAYREAELLDLHREYLELQRVLSQYRAHVRMLYRAQASTDRANREIA